MSITGLTLPRKQAIIEHTINIINQLPEDKAEQICDFADSVIKKFEDKRLIIDIEQVVSNSQSFNFLNDDQDLYTCDKLKIKYNG